MSTEFLASLAAGVLALFVAALLTRRVMSQDDGNETMVGIAVAIQEGSMAFLKREYTYLAVFVFIVTIVVGALVGPKTAISYVLGAVISGATGYLGMIVATRANVRTAAAAIKGLNPALQVAFSSGAVMGLSVVVLLIINPSIPLAKLIKAISRN